MIGCGGVDYSEIDGGWADVGSPGLGKVHPFLVGGPMVGLRVRVGESVYWGRFKFGGGGEERDINIWGPGTDCRLGRGY